MNRYRSDRRLSGRYKVKTPLRVRLWKSALPECTAESVNLSQRGIYFSTNSELRKGETVEVLFHMPEEVVGEPTGEWRCTGHVVRVEEIKTPSGKLGVGVQFDCYEVSRSTPIDVAIGVETPVRMLSDVAPNGDRIQPWKRERLSWTMNQPHAS
jgi:Tfp pilus assembly protein PilZ